MTQDEAKKVIYSSKFVENQHIYGFARRNAARAVIEVDTYIKNHTFMNNYIEKRYGHNGNSNSNGSTNSMSGGKYGGGVSSSYQNTNNSNAGYYRGGSSNYSQQQQQNGGYRGGGNGYFLHQNDRKYGMAQQHYNNR